MFKGVVVGNRVEFGVMGEIFEGGFVVLEEELRKVDLEGGRRDNGDEEDVGGLRGESEGGKVGGGERERLREVVEGVWGMLRMFEFEGKGGDGLVGGRGRDEVIGGEFGDLMGEIRGKVVRGVV